MRSCLLEDVKSCAHFPSGIYWLFCPWSESAIPIGQGLRTSCFQIACGRQELDYHLDLTRVLGEEHVYHSGRARTKTIHNSSPCFGIEGLTSLLFQVSNSTKMQAMSLHVHVDQQQHLWKTGDSFVVITVMTGRSHGTV